MPILILASLKSTLAPLDGKNSLRELHVKVTGSKLEGIGRAEHEIYIDRAEDYQRAYLDFLGNV